MNEAAPEPPDGDPARAPRYWPSDHPPAEHESLTVQCAACAQPWRVHQRMRGFRLRCDCGAWVDLPAPAPTTTTPPAALTAPNAAADPTRLPVAGSRPGQGGLVELPGDDGEVLYQPIPTDQPMAPGTLRRASSSNQARWTNRTVVEFVLLMVALLGPQVLALVLAYGGEFELLLPFASLMSAALVAVVVAWAGPHGRLGLRPAAPLRFAEAIGAAAAGVLIATGYSLLLEQLAPELEPDGLRTILQRLGLPAALFVVAVTPAVLEEIIFRGLLQGRLMALYGRGLGMFVTAVGFALCHGSPLVLPIHLGLGLYLGWLRDRAQSLLPGMLMHFVYNGTLVWLAQA